jgi:diamine N-acetyltransferase
MRVIIRPGNISELEAIRAVAIETWWHTYPSIISEAQIIYMLDKMYDPETLTHAWETGKQLFFVAENPTDHSLVGIAGYGPLDGQIFRLHKLYVRPGIHKSGAGKALLDAVEAEARQAQATALELNVNIANPAVSFYEKMGFYVKEREDLVFGPYFMNDYILRKDL